MSRFKEIYSPKWSSFFLHFPFVPIIFSLSFFCRDVLFFDCVYNTILMVCVGLWKSKWERRELLRNKLNQESRISLQWEQWRILISRLPIRNVELPIRLRMATKKKTALDEHPMRGNIPILFIPPPWWTQFILQKKKHRPNMGSSYEPLCLASPIHRVNGEWNMLVRISSEAENESLINTCSSYLAGKTWNVYND